MNIDTKSEHITPVDRNIFLDLGFSPEDAAALKADAERRMNQKDAIKASLIDALVRWMEDERLNPSDATHVFDMTKQTASLLLNKKMDQFSIDQLVSLLIKVGSTIDISVTAIERNTK